MRTSCSAYVPVVSFTFAAWLAACASTPSTPASKIPASLAVPTDATAFLTLAATGVQIYECTLTAASGFDWTFKAPEAQLRSSDGAPAGKHYAGPTWASIDGSTVVGQLKAKDPGPTAGAIPWLLLTAKSTDGTGALTKTTYIQRIETEGGIAPASGCDAAHVGAVARVPYAATYVFYR